jgi:hypothetical protein
MSVQMIAVQSSMFASLGFNPFSAEIYAQYHTGTLGAYGPSTQAELDAVLNSPDGIGKSFNRLIKPVKKYRKVEDETEQAIAAGVHDSQIPDAILAAPIDLPAPEATLKSDALAIVEVPTTELALNTTSLAEKALALAITTPAAHTVGQELIIAIGDMRKEVVAFFEPMKKAAHAAHKAVTTKENETLAPLEAANAELGKRIKAFEKQVAADVAAEQERLRVAQQAQAEEDARIEAERLAIDDAIALEAAGDIQAAEAVLSNPVPVTPRHMPTPIVSNPLSRVTGAGKHLRDKGWRAVVTNIDLVPREWLIVDQVALDNHARSRKNLAVVPGVRFEPAE